MIGGLRLLARLVGLIVLCLLSLQLYFAARIALMAVIAPTLRAARIDPMATLRRN